jgi:hypothetical protein
MTEFSGTTRAKYVLRQKYVRSSRKTSRRLHRAVVPRSYVCCWLINLSVVKMSKSHEPTSQLVMFTNIIYYSKSMFASQRYPSCVVFIVFMI